MGFPTLTLEVAFTTDPGDTPAWTDLTAYLEGRVVIDRGRSQETDRFGAGTLELTLQNEDRRFDPTNTAGPYYPNIVPMRRVRLRATYAAVTYDVFNGYVDGWEQVYEHPQVAHCRLTATDAFKVLANIELPSSVYEIEVRADSPAHWWRLGGPGPSFPDAVGTAHAEPAGVAPTAGVAGLVVRDPDTAIEFSLAGGQVLQADSAAPSGTGDYTVELIFKTDTPPAIDGLFLSTGTYPESGFEDIVMNAAGVIYSSGIGTGGPVATGTWDDGDPHHFVLVRDAGDQYIYIDGVDRTVTPEADTGNRPGGRVRFGHESISFGGTLDEVAIYPHALSPARIAAHASARSVAWSGELSGARVNRILDAAGWPAADRDIDPGDAVLQGADLGGTALAALQKVEETEQGRLYVTAGGAVRFLSRSAVIQSPYTDSQATFGDSGAELEYADLTYRYDDSTIANEVVVSRAEGVAQTVTDTTSVAKYLRRSLVLTGLLHTDDSTSVDLANWKLAHYKDPLLRATQVRLEPDAGNEATHFPEVLGRELTDRVRFLRRPQSVGTAIDQETHIESVKHQVSDGLHWVTTWNLSPADTQTYAAWDASTALWDQAKWSF